MIAIDEHILAATNAELIKKSESVQTLWSGYGQIKRYHLAGGDYPSVIAKHIQWPDASNHPRGWNTELSHQRKQRSYLVETTWYQQYAHQTDAHCRVPQLLHEVSSDTEMLLVMEDLNACGFSSRLTPGTVTLDKVKSCLRWLARFHARFMNVDPNGLWPIGTYWHLDTRPDEWAKMKNTALKEAAQAIDKRLNQTRFQTLVHGDAKLANFCFGDAEHVAAVDFQYVGGGCGMKDVAYCISSCLDDEACERFESELLDCYFNELEVGMDNRSEFQLVMNEWLGLYRYAWADFYRFLDGWSPGHWKMHRYSQNLTNQVTNEFSQ